MKKSGKMILNARFEQVLDVGRQGCRTRQAYSNENGMFSQMFEVFKCIGCLLNLRLVMIN